MMNTSNRFLRYGVAVAASLLALLFRVLLTPLLDEQAPLILFVPAIVISSLYGGVGPGIVATALTAALSAYFLLPPFSSLVVQDPRQQVSLVLFLLQGVLLSVLTGALRTARQRAELALAQRKMAEGDVRFRVQLLDTVEQAVIATDPDGRIIYWNRCAATLYGWQAAEVIGRPVVDIMPVPSAREETEVIREKVRAGESWSGEIWMHRRDGISFPALVSATPVYDEQGALIASLYGSSDISERKRAEEANRFLADASVVLASSLDVATLLNTLAQLAVPRLADWCAVDMIEADGSYRRLALAHTDPTKIELAWEMERRYGFDRELPEGAARVLRTGEPVLYPEISDAMLVHITHDAEHLRMVQSIGLRSGMIVPLIARERILGAISLGAAESGRIFGSGELQLAGDLAQRAALAIDNAHLYEQAQSAIRLRDDFLSIAAHELKTPVTSVLAYSQVLRRRAARDPMLAERNLRALEVIEAQSQRLSRLISTLLEVSRLSTGHFHLDPQMLDLRTLVQRIAEEVQPTLESHSLVLSMTDEPVPLRGDPLRLEQVLQNLIQNAVKYSPAGGSITIRLDRRNLHAVLTVTDQGIGIPQAALPQLFQRFFRAANSAQTNTAGMGIGLYVVHEIVTRHAGTIEVASKEGKGTTFTVCLPLSAPTT